LPPYDFGELKPQYETPSAIGSGNSSAAADIPLLSPVPIDPVGQATKARHAASTSWRWRGCDATNENSPGSPNVSGANCRQVSQLMQVESTNQPPGTFSTSRRFRSAIIPGFEQGATGFGNK